MSRDEDLVAHIGALAYKGTGHLNPLLALSRRLIAHGHRVTFFQHPDLQCQILQQGVEFFPISSGTPGKVQLFRRYRWMQGLGLGEIDDRLRRIDQEIATFLSVYPSAIRAAGVDALLLGEISLAGPTVAELLGLPYFIVSTSIPHNFGWKAPRSITGPRSMRVSIRNAFLEISLLRLRGPVRRILDRYRRQLRLGPIRSKAKNSLELAHITQWPQCLEDQLPQPAETYYTGPFIDCQGRTRIDFPWDRLDGRPLVYASLGTTRKGELTTFYRIAEACSELHVQLIITLGGRRDPAVLAELPGDPVIVSNAPQLELMQKASMVITHAGPNTVLEALMLGKPMLALPITLDQPAVAWRLARSGAAEVLSPQHRSTRGIRHALAKVLEDPHYRQAALRLKAEMSAIDGIGRAVEIIESKLAVVSPELHVARLCHNGVTRTGKKSL